MLEIFHDAKSAGHIGKDKTLGKLREYVHWSGMGEDARICFIL